MTTEQKVLVFDPEKCTGCLYCEVACSFKHYGAISFEKSFIRIVGYPKIPFRFIAVHCAHCEHPMCRASCPSEAIEKNEDTGIVKIDKVRCIGCLYCQIACPVSNPRFDEELRVAVKCDLCDGDPLCARQCSTGAMAFVDREDARKLMERKTSE